MPKRAGYKEFKFDLEEQDYALLRRIARADDRTMAGWLRLAIRAEAARRGLARPRALAPAGEVSDARP